MGRHFICPSVSNTLDLLILELLQIVQLLWNKRDAICAIVEDDYPPASMSGLVQTHFIHKL